MARRWSNVVTRWRVNQPIHLEYRNDLGLEEQAPIVAAARSKQTMGTYSCCGSSWIRKKSGLNWIRGKMKSREMRIILTDRK